LSPRKRRQRSWRQAIFADIRPDTYNLDPSESNAASLRRTRAIVVVHLYGLAADMDPILAFAKSRKLPVIEDNAQAIGASYKGRRTGSLGDAACVSFYPTKKSGRVWRRGNGGDEFGATRAHIRTLRNHGQSEKYRSNEAGWNSRLDEIQPPFLRVKCVIFRIGSAPANRMPLIQPALLTNSRRHAAARLPKVSNTSTTNTPFESNSAMPSRNS